MNRRTILTVGLLAAVAGMPPSAWAQPYPSRPVKIVVPFPAGGAADYVGRVYGEDMSKQLGQPFVIENKPGASGTLGSAQVAKAPPDGYTLVLGSFSTHGTAKLLMKDLSYDPQTDFTPISLLAMVPTLLVSSAKLPAGTVAELIALARAKPGTLNYGSVGPGTSMHLAGEVFRREAAIDIVHVPYKGQNVMIPELASGQIHFIFNNYTSSIGMIRSGQLNALAIALDKRWPDLPDVQTFAEAGLPNVKISSWTAIFAPAGLPADVTAVLEKASRRAVDDPGVRQRLLQSGNLPVGGGPAELRQFISEQRAYWAENIKQAGVQPQ